MRISRREILRFAANGLPGWLALGFYLADRQSPEPQPVPQAADFEAAFDGAVRRRPPKIHDVGVQFAGKAEASFALSLDVIQAS